MSDYILGAILIAIFIWLQRSKKRNVVPKEKACDWLQVKEIDEDGLITTEDDRYMLMVEIVPVSFELKSQMERKMVMSVFRETLNMISHPIRFRVESHPFDLEDYFADLKAKAIETGDPLNSQYVDELRYTFAYYIEQNKVQDRRYYIFLETDHEYLAELSIDTANPLLHSLMKKRAAKDHVAELDAIKEDLLASLRIIQSMYHTVGLWTRPMKRKDVLSYLYNTVNREVSTALSYEDLEEKVAQPGEKITSVTGTFSNSDNHTLKALEVLQREPVILEEESGAERNSGGETAETDRLILT